MQNVDKDSFKAQCLFSLISLTDEDWAFSKENFRATTRPLHLLCQEALTIPFVKHFSAEQYEPLGTKSHYAPTLPCNRSVSLRFVPGEESLYGTQIETNGGLKRSTEVEDLHKKSIEPSSLEARVHSQMSSTYSLSPQKGSLLIPSLKEIGQKIPSLSLSKDEDSKTSHPSFLQGKNRSRILH
jgi:hypothetical protein